MCYFWFYECISLLVHCKYRFFVWKSKQVGGCLTILNGMGETKKRGCTRKCNLFLIYTPIQEVMPKVVAIAVRTVMTILMIFPQMFLFSMLISYECLLVLSLFEL